MINKAWWEPTSEADAWQKIIMAGQEDLNDSARTAVVLLDGIPSGEVALEIGCGVGRLMKEMVGKFQRVFGVDIAQGMVDHSKNYLRNYPQCEVLLGDGEHIPMDDACVDFVYSYIAFQHMPTLEVIQTNVNEIARVLRPGGFCRVQTIRGTPFYCDERESMHYMFKDEAAFLDPFVKAGLFSVATAGLIHPATLWVTAEKPL